MKATDMIKLSDSLCVQPIGFGTCKNTALGNAPIDDIILDAIALGYRYFDTASFYCTERDLGRAIKKSGINRDEIQIASKLWYEELGYKNAKDACKRSLSRLGLEYLDLYLIHWPKASMEDENWKETVIETWQALIELKAEGLVKNLGVSNFLPHHLQVIFDNSNEKPVIDQLELHIGYFQEYAVKFLFENGIQPQGWSPLGRGKEIFTSNRILNDIAKKYNVSVQKLGLRFLTQRDIMPIVWSSSKEHMKENLNIFDFDISAEDMSMIACMPQENWLGEHPDFYLPLSKHVDMNQ